MEKTWQLAGDWQIDVFLLRLKENSKLGIYY